MTDATLTSRQQQILELISEELARTGSFPPLSWIAARVGITTKRGVAVHLDALARKGYIARKTQYFELKNQGSFPFAASIAAGAPQEAFDSSERITFAPHYFGRGKLAAVRVSGESMAGDSIHDGDVVIIALDRTPSRNDIAAVRIDTSEVTLKRFVLHDHGEVELLSSNPLFPPQRYAADRIAVIGVYVGLVRRK